MAKHFYVQEFNVLNKCAQTCLPAPRTTFWQINRKACSGRPFALHQQHKRSKSLRCQAASYPQPLLQWAVEAAEDPDLTMRLISLAAVDLGMAVLFFASFAISMSSKEQRRLLLPNDVESERSEGSLGRVGSGLKTYFSQLASQIPTGASVLMLAEQESALTAEEGAIEECLVQAINDERDPAAAFLKLFITGFKRTWLSNTISEAVLTTCCHQRFCSLSAAAMLLERISNPKAIFRPPLESLLVNGELMEAIGIYSLAMVMKAQRFFKSLDSLKSFF